MTRRATLALPMLAGAMFLVSCGGNSVVSPSGLPAATPAVSVSVATSTPGPTPGRVAIISIDGLRPDALAQAGASHILSLADRGAYTWRAQTVLPATTLPSHASMLSGYAPEVHGIWWNEYAPTQGTLPVPTLFSAARAHGLRTAMVVGKDKFATFRDTGACDTWLLSSLGDDDVVLQATMVITAARPDLIFVHLPGVDLAGHTSKWMSAPYLDAVRRADQAVGRLLAWLPNDTTVILTADHGGHGIEHGAEEPADTTIPWIIAGPAIVSGRQLTSTVATVDTAATAALLLGVQLPRDVTGRSVSEAFLRR